MDSRADFFLIDTSALADLRRAAQPELVTRGYLFLRRRYEVDHFEEALEAAGEHRGTLEGSGMLLSSMELLLQETLEVDLGAFEDPELSGAGRTVYTLTTDGCRALDERWPADGIDGDTIWSVLQSHGFVESQRAYAQELRAGLSRLREWVDAVSGDSAGLLVLSFEP